MSPNTTEFNLYKHDGELYPAAEEGESDQEYAEFTADNTPFEIKKEDPFSADVPLSDAPQPDVNGDTPA